MKIDHLPIGARFLWKGVAYTKAGPMTASADSGGSVFVPKHAVLQPVPGEAPPPPAAPESGPIDAAKVLAAFETYHQTALTLAGEDGRCALESARQRFIAEIR
mgnify:FL=1